MRPIACALLLLVATACGFAAADWHHPLYIGNGGLWHQRIAIEVRNDMAREVEGEPVAVRIGKAAGEADLVGAMAEAVRVCNAEGVEMLFDIAAPGGRLITKGPIPAGGTLTIPAECPANGTATYYVYFDNSAAWGVPDFLNASAGVRNGGMEEGGEDVPDGWRHDSNDDEHQTSWVTENPRSGKKCLKTVVAEGAEHTWIATRQSRIHIIGGAEYRMTAWVKAENVVGNAGWYIHVGNEKNSMIISPMLYSGDGTYDWKKVTAEFVAPQDANRSDLGTVLRGTGTAWFDDVTLECQERSKLSATAGTPERLQLEEIGADAPWYDEREGDLRALSEADRRRVKNMVEEYVGRCAMSRDDLLKAGNVGLSRAAAKFDERKGVQFGEYADWWIRWAITYAIARDGEIPRSQNLAWDYRVPVKVMNLSDQPLDEALVRVDTSVISARLRGKLNEDSIRVTDNGKPVPHYQAKDSLLFDGEVPAHTAKTYYAYFSADPRIESARATDYATLLDSDRNLVKNPSFELGDQLPDDWPGGAEGERPARTTTGFDTPGLFGERCAKMHIPHDSKKAWTGWRQDVPVEHGKTYMFSAWLKTEDIEPNVQLHAHYRNAEGELCAKKHTGAGPAISGTKDWTMISGTFEMPEDIATFQLHLTMLATGTVWHDGVVLAEAVPGTTGGLESRAPQELAGLTVWPVNAVVKVFQDDVPPREAPPARITAARNDKEPLQLAIRSPEALENVTVTVDPPTNAQGDKLTDIEVTVVGYVPMDHKTSYYSSTSPAWHRKFPTGPGGCDGWAGWWPDPLLPRNAFDLKANVTQPIWITVSVPKDAAPGDYTGHVRLGGRGPIVNIVPFTVRVWDFTLPDENHVKAIYDCRQGRQWAQPGKSREELFRQMWAFMAERRVCPDTIRIAPKINYENGEVAADFADFDEAAEYYFNELKLPHSYTPWMFYCFGWGHLPGKKFGEAPYEGEYPYEGVDRSQLRPEFKRAYQACLRVFWDHLKEKGWRDKVVLYISDEPHHTSDDIKTQMKALCDMIHEVDPDIPIYCSTWSHYPDWDGYLDVWGIGHYGRVMPDKIKELQAAGDRIWWTTDGQMCTDTPYCAIERLLPHYCFKYDAEAYEFWGIDWLTYDPYEFGWHRYNPHTFEAGGDTSDVRYPNGDGFLAYPGGPIGHDGPVSSVRLEQAREGVEDYEYLYLLRELVAKAKAAGKDASEGEKALQMADELVEMPCAIGRYSTKILPNPDVVLEVKEAVARAIEGLRE